MLNAFSVDVEDYFQVNAFERAIPRDAWGSFEPRVERNTRRLLETARPDDVGVSVSYPLPGTKFYELVKDQLGRKTHWQDSNDLEMMFEGTYTSDFYRRVRDLLHDQVSLDNLDDARSPAERHRARRSVQRRWQALLSEERHFRSWANEPATSGHGIGKHQI